MNRLVIVGNGFDLAHGLPTRYKDFIDDYWKNIKDSNHDELVSFNLDSYSEFCGHENLNALIDTIVNINNIFRKEGIEVYKLKDHLRPLTDNRIQILQYKNLLFKLINQRAIENWVDVENEYYRELKRIVKSSILSDEEKKQKVIVLNQEFEEVKNLLEKYLKEKINFDENGIKPISDLFKLDRRTHDYYLEFPSQDHETLEKFQNEYDMDLEKGKSITTYFLNFNYTKTIDTYLNYAEGYRQDRFFGIVKNIQIHGRLNDSSNEINFGFGDEMDDDYKIIENLDDNEYLRNFKSFQYSQNSNYKYLLNFIDSEKFQVYIMGHSCGLSDRTLLNTIFEHNNCRSIKVFYYQREDGTDNYTEIIQNISRHFNKKKLMREKIVNKSLCQPLLKNKASIKIKTAPIPESR